MARPTSRAIGTLAVKSLLTSTPHADILSSRIDAREEPWIEVATLTLRACVDTKVLTARVHADVVAAPVNPEASVTRSLHPMITGGRPYDTRTGRGGTDDPRVCAAITPDA